ncbi:MAG TPA: hypothetical protein VJJ21_03890 [Candidatus Nanoarchaeia archaeon]|nr:hypothetical protein [Candidatus Nanoarchaeia archaeon]
MEQVSLQTIHEDLRILQREVQQIKEIIIEDFKLTEDDKKALKSALKEEKEGKLLSKKQVFN